MVWSFVTRVSLGLWALKGLGSRILWLMGGDRGYIRTSGSLLGC